MTQGWRWPLAALAFIGWYVLVVADSIQDLLENRRNKKHWREHVV